MATETQGITPASVDKLQKLFSEYPDISASISKPCLAKISTSTTTPYANDLDFIETVEAIFQVKHACIEINTKLEGLIMKAKASKSEGVTELTKLAKGYEELHQYGLWLVQQRLKAHTNKASLPRVVRLGEKVSWTEKEIYAIVFLILAYPNMINYTNRDYADMVIYSGMDVTEALNFVSSSREHVKQNIISISPDDPIYYAFKLGYSISCILSGLDITEEKLLKFDRTLLAVVLLEEDPVKYSCLTRPGALGQSTDPEADSTGGFLAAKKEVQNGEGSDEKPEGEEGDKPEEKDKEKKKEEKKDIFELIREEVESEKLLDDDEEQSGDPADDKKIGPYTSNVNYLSDHVEWLSSLLKMKETELYVMGDTHKSPENDIQLREMKAKERMQRSKCERRCQITSANGKWRPRLEKLAAHMQLTPFEKYVLLLLCANVLSPKINPHGGYGSGSVSSFTVGQIINIFCDSFETEITYRSYFYRNSKLIRDGIVTLSESFGSTEIMNASVEIDRRMLDFIVGLDTEFGELVEGSHLYLPTVEISQVILPEDQKNLIVNTVENFDKFQKAKKKLGFDDVVSYGNGMVILFFGKSGTGKTMMANALAKMLQKRVLLINYPSLGNSNSDLVIKYIFREAKLTDSIIFFDECESIFISRDQVQGKVNLVLTELERHNQLVIMATNRAFDLDEAMHRRITFAMEFKMPDPLLRAKIWKAHIPAQIKLADDVDFSALALKYELTGGFIKNTVLAALSSAVPRDIDNPVITMADLEQGAVHQLRSRLAMVDFDRRVVPSRGLEDIIVSAEVQAKLRKIVRMEKARQVLYSEWGYTEKNANDLGTTVLMYGPPGTGKTVSAEAIGFETGKPLKVINTAELVSKWVGETGKNIEAVFTEARSLDAIIVFDDAESIFGARHAEQTTSTDRYANLDTSALLYHMERFPGIAVVTTNLATTIDPAFMRRFRFTIEFEMPKANEREKLWRGQLPPKAPLADDINFKLLAEKYQFSGGVIKNCCFKAAATAALRDLTTRKISMQDILEAADEEMSVSKGPANLYV